MDLKQASREELEALGTKEAKEEIRIRSRRVERAMAIIRDREGF